MMIIQFGYTISIAMASIVFYFLVIMCLIHSLYARSDIRVHGGTSILEESNKPLIVLKLAVNLHGGIKKTCTGSVLNANWIVSAAHCFRYKNIETVTVEHFKNGRFEKVGDLKTSKIKVHPNYDEDESVKAAKHDVALLNVKTNNTRFVQLAKELPKVGQVATIIGFGDTENKPGPNKGEVIVQRTKNIIRTFGNIGGSHGDSGGALVMENQLVGIVSRRKCKTQCATYYADIYSNLKWIEHVIN